MISISPLVPELYCRDLAISLPFYREVLGFELQYYRPEHGFVMLHRQGAQLMLEDLSKSDRVWATGELEPPFGRGISLQIKTTAVDVWYQTVLAAKAPIFLTMEEKWYRVDEVELGNRQFIVQDPNGFLLRFFEDLGSRPIVSV